MKTKKAVGAKKALKRLINFENYYSGNEDRFMMYASFIMDLYKYVFGKFGNEDFIKITAKHPTIFLTIKLPKNPRIQATIEDLLYRIAEDFAKKTWSETKDNFVLEVYF
jgi:hypothetical protein